MFRDGDADRRAHQSVRAPERPDRRRPHHRRLRHLPVARLSVPAGGRLRAAALHREARHLPRADQSRHRGSRSAPVAAGHAGGDQMSARSIVKLMSRRCNRRASWLEMKTGSTSAARKSFPRTPLKRVTAMNRELAVSLKDGKFGAVSNACNHVGGPLGDGRLDGDYIVCPWHNWKFHRCSGVGEPGFEEDRVPAYPVKVENGRVLVNLNAGSKRAEGAARAASAVAQGRACAGAVAPCRHFDVGDGRRQPALLRLGPSARSCLESRAAISAPRRG